MSSPAVNLAQLQTSVGQTDVSEDEITYAPLARLAALLDCPDTKLDQGNIVPPLWHWLYFLPCHPQSELGPDGHARRGGFMPDVGLKSRMWAGSRLQWHGCLRVGESVRRTSRILSVEHKAGRSGDLVFVVVRHEIGNELGPVLTEEHDIVYRRSSSPGGLLRRQMAPCDEDWRRRINPDATLLFRYSALTFNSHRIHYDRSYARDEEGYPGLVVHGPLIATFLVELMRTHFPKNHLARFSFRALSPIFDGMSFDVCGKRQPDSQTVRLWARDEAGQLAMDAETQLVPNEWFE